MGLVYIVLMILILISTVFEMYALYTGDWEFPFWCIIPPRSLSSVFLMSVLSFGFGITYGWVSAFLSLAAYIFVYIALYFYITMKAPRKIYPKKRSASDIIFWIVIVTVVILRMALDDSQNAAFIIIFFLFNIFFLFLPLYYLFEIREEKLEEKRQQEEEKRRQEDERIYQEEEERRKEKEEEWIIITEEMDINSKSEENL